MISLFTLQKFAAGTLIALAIGTSAQAAVFSVPGTSDPWLAGQPDGTTASAGDIAPTHSPVFAGSFMAGDTIIWSATGSVDHTGGVGVSGPNGGAVFSHLGGAENGIADLSAPINSLVGIFFGGGVGTPFFMGSAGTAVVPAGMTDLYLGSMDGFGWYNNSGSFEVNLTVRSPDGSVPEGGSFVGLYALAVGLIGYGLLKKKPVTV